MTNTMMTIEISIGPTGLTLPVTFLELVKAHLKIGLAAAKRALDTLTSEKVVVLSFEDCATAEAFRREVEGLGLMTREL